MAFAPHPKRPEFSTASDQETPPDNEPGALENRTLLSNVTVSFPAPGTASTLPITGDTSNDNFAILENTRWLGDGRPGATRRRPGCGGRARELDRRELGAPFNTSNPVKSIVVTLPGTNNFDFVTLIGRARPHRRPSRNVTVTAAGANLTFAAGQNNGVDNSGNFVLSDTSTSSTDAALTANVDNSSFVTLSITQTGGGPDHRVELGNNNIPGSVVVSEGNASGSPTHGRADRRLHHPG